MLQGIASIRQPDFGLLLNLKISGLIDETNTVILTLDQLPQTLHLNNPHC